MFFLLLIRNPAERKLKPSLSTLRNYQNKTLEMAIRKKNNANI